MLVTKLLLHLFIRNAFLRGTHQVHDNEPYPKWKIRVFHNSSTSEGSSGSTLCTLKLLNVHSVVFGVLTFFTLYDNVKAVIPIGIPTRLLIRIMLNKLYKIHNHQFEAKLELMTVTNLRSGY